MNTSRRALFGLLLGAPLGAAGTPTGTVSNLDGGATGGFTVSGVDKNGKPITAAAAFVAAHQRHRVDLQKQRRGASLLSRFRIEDVRNPARDLERLNPGRVLVQQEA